MKRDWLKAIEKLPPGLSYLQASKRLRAPYSSLRLAMIKFGYSNVDGHHQGQLKNRTLIVEKVDWSQTNADIGRKYGVSRERVRFMRRRLGKAKTSMLASQR